MTNTPFLKAVAEDLYNKIGQDLSRTAVVFPNKRAGLFFNQWLASCTDKPVWTPAYMTISELFRQLTPLQVADPIRLVCTLYTIFCEETNNEKETLDNFYFWGEMLIADFDDLDKNRVNADRLFQNLQ
ncbi:MAG: PD-(D/E)XK nuclease family protein, partial [Bacteroidaceae bacterium]|nr:PD-(D/E)XK nuclease family protein [Bacteroidaceae bacterium]